MKANIKCNRGYPETYGEVEKNAPTGNTEKMSSKGYNLPVSSYFIIIIYIWKQLLLLLTVVIILALFFLALPLWLKIWLRVIGHVIIVSWETWLKGYNLTWLMQPDRTPFNYFQLPSINKLQWKKVIEWLPPTTV